MKHPKVHETDHVLPGGSPLAVTGAVNEDMRAEDGSSPAVVSAVELYVADLPRDKRLIAMRKLADRLVKEYNRFVDEKGGRGRIVIHVLWDYAEREKAVDAVIDEFAAEEPDTPDAPDTPDTPHFGYDEELETLGVEATEDAPTTARKRPRKSKA